LKLKERCIVALLLLGIVIGSCSFRGSAPSVETSGLAVASDSESDAAQKNADHEREHEDDYDYFHAVVDRDFRAVWVTTVINLDFPSRQGISADAMRSEIDDIIARTVELGLNAIIFQVRPTGDAFYESSIFPWSHWLSGTQGEGIAGFDPLQYWIDASHQNGLELHAWINPYRIIHTISNSSDPNTLAPNNPVRLRPDLAVGWTDTNGREGLFLDPGLPEARQLIIDGIEDLIRNYDVDGIHFDDYFYPGRDFDDAATFARYGNGMDLHDWRRENVNTLIRDIQSTISGLNDELDRTVLWGISPTAIWKNGSSDPRGVPTTRGMESYHALYADTRLWVLEELVDYINPQIYWYIGFEIADFEAVLNWWIDLCRGTNVELYIGLAAWREEEDHQSPRWRGEILRQLEMMEASDVVGGAVFFRMGFLNGALGDAIRDFYIRKDLYLGDRNPNREPVMLLDTLSVGTPRQNATITANAGDTAGVNITGTSDPNQRLFVNGTEVTSRTIEGFFFAHLPLEPGQNEFEFTQVGQAPVTRTINRSAPQPPTTPSGPGATITRIETPTYATITSDTAWAFPRNTATGGSDWMMVRGQMDRVIAESSNGFVQLSMGKWVLRTAVSLSTPDDFVEDVLQNGRYDVGDHYDVIIWQTDVFSGVYAHFDGQLLTVDFGMHTEPPPLELPEDLTQTMFYSVSSGMDGDVPYHAFAIRADARFDGHFVRYEDNELRLYLRRRKTLAAGVRPLTGITVVLDPGHGGDEYGAIGPLGRDMPEKDLVMVNAHKLTERLTALGATVHSTRYSDVSVTLQERVALSRQVKPDIFISLHINSVAETTNAGNVRGFTVWYRNPGSAGFARTVLDIMYDVNPGTNRYRNINQANFYVCRPQWAPHVLFESSFIVNIDDFVWLIDPMQQARLADASVEAILAHFSSLT